MTRRCERVITVEVQQVHHNVRKGVTVSSRLRSAVDHAFEIWGSPAVSGVDIASIFAEASVRMGDSVWVGYVPVAGGLTCRVRLSKSPIQSGGDAADLTLVLDPQLFGRGLADDAFPSGADVLIDNDILAQQLHGPSGRGAWHAVTGEAASVQRLPLQALAAHIPSVVHGDRLIALGMLAWAYRRDPDVVRKLLENKLAPRGRRAVSAALRLFELGWREAPRWVACRVDITRVCPRGRRCQVMDGRRALVSGALAAGINVCRLAALHPLVDGFGRVFVEQGGRLVGDESSPRPGAPDAPDTPRLAVEAAGFPRRWVADRGELSEVDDDAAPQVVIRLERLVPDDAPMVPAWIDPLGMRARDRRAVVLAPTTVEECFHFVRLAAHIARQYRRDVVVLVDAMLLGAVQGWTAHSGPDIAGDPGADIDTSYALLDPEAVLAPTTAAFPDEAASGAVRRLLHRLHLSVAPFETFVRPAQVVGGDEGDTLLVGWGATRGPVEEAVARLRSEGRLVSSLHLRTLQPLPPRLADLMAAFRRVVAIDVLTERHDVAARLRRVRTMLRAAMVVQSRQRHRASGDDGVSRPARPMDRLSTYAFPHRRPLSPRAVYDLALRLEGGR